MTKKFVAGVRNSEIAMRPVLPLAFPLDIGQVGTVGDDGAFTLLGSITSTLGVNLGAELPVQDKGLAVSVSSGRSVQVKFGADAKTDGPLSQFSDIKAKASITFGSADSFFLAVNGLKIRQLAEPQKFIDVILRAYKKHVWHEDWVFVHQVGTAKRVTAILASEADTTALLRASARAKVPGAEVDLAAGFSFAASTKSVTQITGGKDLTMFYNAFRVRDSVFRKPVVQQLRADLAFGLEPDDTPAEDLVAVPVDEAYRTI